MKKALLILALPLAQFAAANVFAADMAAPDAPKTRMEVKDETKAAIKSGDSSTKAGEAGPAAVTDKKAAVSTKTRKEVKDDTKSAAKAGELPKAGEAANTAMVEKKPMSNKSRMDVKDSVKKAEGDMTLNKAGENIKNGK